MTKEEAQRLTARTKIMLNNDPNNMGIVIRVEKGLIVISWNLMNTAKKYDDPFYERVSLWHPVGQVICPECKGTALAPSGLSCPNCYSGFAPA